MVTHSKNSHDSLADPALLDKIDKLFACNVGEYINLPQLVVVGDQSSGKSSVLEGLTKLAFPRDSGLCTRFATQIIFRRVEGVDRSITATIIPGKNAENPSELQEWKTTDLQDLSAASFGEMMSKVYTLMGLSVTKEDAMPTFSENVLRLEICGPDEDHLSVIDVPGIFRNTTPGVTTKEDKDMVRKMVLDYMTNPRSIMLTVVPANVDIATQEIIDMAREVDPDGKRTLGVLTKPDLVDKGAENKVIDLVEDREMRLKLGWIIVRNLGQIELQDLHIDRDAAEERFRHTAPWNGIPRDRFGIKALKIRLQETVTSNAREAFPLLRAEIGKRLKSCQDKLQVLGAERETPEQQTRYLLGVMSSFQEITQQALSTNYSSNNHFDHDLDLRLATRIVNRNDSFSGDMASWGHEYRFAEDTRDESSQSDGEIDAEDEDEDEDEGYEDKNRIVETRQLITRKTTRLHGLEDVLDGLEDEAVKLPLKGKIYPWIEKQYHSSRGFEIGTFNSTLLSIVMKQQSTKWTTITHGYIDDMITMTHGFILKALKLACPDTRVRQNLMAFLLDRLLDRYKEAINKVKFLLLVERSGTPMTLNHYLNDNLEKCRQKRFASVIEKKTFSDCSHGKVVRFSDITHQHHMSNVKHTIQDIHDILHSYYKVARKRFVDSVCMQAVDYHLVTGPRTPMALFSPYLVHSFSKEQLEEIAGEETALRRKRRQLRKEVQDLQKAKKILF
ncbi:Interferon-induced GTP-binding protein Mx [Talaromyces islandicus]|uniref:Interferon-induced GTP-binding protein Mx n=1 Tax=Talaromyces islandicus TaxID=28573 RepID=A0A0U1LSU6_TALIS|nr:Interferon-induced GTP-binding protein Mx [Talaromyces islandicus]